MFWKRWSTSSGTTESGLTAGELPFLMCHWHRESDVAVGRGRLTRLQHALQLWHMQSLDTALHWISRQLCCTADVESSKH